MLLLMMVPPVLIALLYCYPQGKGCETGGMSIPAFFACGICRARSMQKRRPSLTKFAPVLLEMEANAGAAALLAQRKHPFIAHFAGAGAGFAAGHHFADARIQPFCKVHRAEQRFANDKPAADGQAQKDIHAFLGAALIFAGKANLHILIAFAPVRRQAFLHARYALGNDGEGHLRPRADARPRFSAPGVGFGQEKIRSHAGIDVRAVRKGKTLRPAAGAWAN